MKIKGLIIIVSISLAACSSGSKATLTKSNSDAKVINTTTQQKFTFPALSLPKACVDPSKKYKPVNKINSRSNYLDPASDYQPINSANGFIQQDFTGDGVFDVIFLEREDTEIKTSKIRLVICESSLQGYQRKLPPFAIYESPSYDFQANSQRIEMTAENELVLIDNHHEHNWGSDSIKSIYRYNPVRKDFELSMQESSSSSGDGMRSDTYEIFFLTTNRYIRRRSCGGLEEGCKSYDSIGRIIPLAARPTLYKYNAGKIFKALKAD